MSRSKKQAPLARVARHSPAKRKDGGSSPSRRSKKKKMKFYEGPHKYIDGDIEYTSVSYLLKTVEPWVDWDKKAASTAKKTGSTKEKVLKEWAEKRDNAAKKGTAFHKMMEDSYTSSVQGIKIAEKYYPLCYAQTIDGVKEEKDVKLEDNTVYTEKMIWSNKYKICGTADLVEVIDGKIYVKDYKTNEKLEFTSWVNPKTGLSEKLKFPCANLDNCKGVKYELQLNLYMYMLLMQNRQLKMGGMEILQIVFHEDGTHEIVPHKVRNLLKEAGLLLEYFRQKKAKNDT